MSINLLPWRETLLQYKGCIFLLRLGACLSFIMIFLFTIQFFIKKNTNVYRNNNRSLQMQIAALPLVAHYQKYHQSYQQLIEKIAFIRKLELQFERFLFFIQHTSNALPTGIRFISLSILDGHFEILGEGYSSQAIIDFSKKISKLNSLNHVRLIDVEIKSSKRGSIHAGLMNTTFRLAGHIKAIKIKRFLK